MVEKSLRQTACSPPRRRLRIAVASTLGPLLVVASGLFFAMNAQAATPPVPLGTAQTYSVLAGQSVTNTGNTNVLGDLGVSPLTTVTGFPPGIVHGTTHQNDGPAIQAKVDLVTAYENADARTPTIVLSELGTQTLLDGVYAADAGGPLTVNGTLTLDGNGDPNSTFIFQTDSTLITGSYSHVVLINGAQACKVYWQVGSSATLGTISTFSGSILALTSITVADGAVVDGQALARNGSVTLDDATFLEPGCSNGSTSTVTGTATATATVTGTTTATTTETTTVTAPAVTETVTDTTTETTTVTAPAVTETVTQTLPGSTLTETLTGSTSTVTDTTTVTAPAVTETVTQTLPGSTLTETLTGSTSTVTDTTTETDTVTAPAVTETVTQTLPGSTLTETLTGSTSTVTDTVTAPAVTETVTQTVGTATVTETLGTATVTETLPGSTVTETLPGSTVTETLPGSTVTETLPGSTVTETLPGSTSTVTDTLTLASSVTPTGGDSGSGQITINSGGGAEGNMRGALLAGSAGLLSLLAGLVVFLRRRQHS